MAVNDIVGIRIVGRYQDQNVVNTIHYKILQQALDNHEILEAFAQDWETNYASAWLGRHTTAYTLIGLRAFSVTGDNKRPGIVHIGDPGLVTGTDMVSALCRTMTLYTNSSNFRRRGRVMISGGVSDMFDIADGAVDATEVALLTTLGEALILTQSFDDNELEPGLAPTDILPFEPFVSAMGRSTPSLIRSRRIKGMLIG